MSDQASENTATELYREPGASPGMEYYQPSVHVTKNGLIGMDVGGMVFVMSIRDWHSKATGSEASITPGEHKASSKLAPLPPSTELEKEIDELLEPMACIDCTGYPNNEHEAAKSKIQELITKHTQLEVEKAKTDLEPIAYWIAKGLDPRNTNKDVPYRCLQVIADILHKSGQPIDTHKERQEI